MVQKLTISTIICLLFICCNPQQKPTTKSESSSRNLIFDFENFEIDKGKIVFLGKRLRFKRFSYSDESKNGVYKYESPFMDGGLPASFPIQSNEPEDDGKNIFFFKSKNIGFRFFTYEMDENSLGYFGFLNHLSKNKNTKILDSSKQNQKQKIIYETNLYEYDRGGKKYFTGKFKAIFPEGKLTLFKKNKDGKLFKSIETNIDSFLDGGEIRYGLTGKLIVFYEDESIKSETMYSNGKINGKHIIYNSNGIKKYEYFLQDGVLDGEYNEFNTSGKITESGYYLNGKKDTEGIRFRKHPEFKRFYDRINKSEYNDWVKKVDRGYYVSYGGKINAMVINVDELGDRVYRVMYVTFGDNRTVYKTYDAKIHSILSFDEWRTIESQNRVKELVERN